jgi:hypothetical protein
MSPTAALTTGVTSVTVTGNMFTATTDAAILLLGAVNATGSCAIQSNMTAICQVPVFTAGLTTVLFSLNGVQFIGGLPSLLVYGTGMMLCRFPLQCLTGVTAPPNLTTVSPPSGPVTGMTNLSVVGGGFVSTGLATVMFVNSLGITVGQVPATFASASQLQCTVPAMPADTYVVAVSLNGQQFISQNASFLVYGTVDSLPHRVP